jgi:hypothetical protein
MNRITQVMDEMIERGIATLDEIILVTTINDYKEETLNNILYARTGYWDIEQLKEENE